MAKTDSDIDLTLPLSNDGKTVRSVFVSFPGRLTAVEWERLLAYLDVMKPGLVAEPAPPPTQATAVQPSTEGAETL
jgi:hypothetical protein